MLCHGSRTPIERLSVVEEPEPGHRIYSCDACAYVGFATDGRLDAHETSLDEDEEC